MKLSELKKSSKRDNISPPLQIKTQFLFLNFFSSSQGNSQSQAALSQSQVATQPLEFSQESLAQVASQGLDDGAWGQLIPWSGTFPRYATARVGDYRYPLVF